MVEDLIYKHLCQRGKSKKIA